MRYDGIIFDMDGTLIESHLDFAVIRRQLGIAASDGIIESINAMPPDLAKEASRKLDEFEMASVRQAKLLPSCRELLSELRLTKIKIALLTRNSADPMAVALDKIGADFFDLTWSRENGPIKPEPDGVLRACKKLGISPEKTICIGDFHYDILAANSAGATSVLLAVDKIPDFAKEADYVITSLSEVMKILK